MRARAPGGPSSTVAAARGMLQMGTGAPVTRPGASVPKKAAAATTAAKRNIRASKQEDPELIAFRAAMEDPAILRQLRELELETARVDSISRPSRGGGCQLAARQPAVTQGYPNLSRRLDVENRARPSAQECSPEELVAMMLSDAEEDENASVARRCGASESTRSAARALRSHCVDDLLRKVAQRVEDDCDEDMVSRSQDGSKRGQKLQELLRREVDFHTKVPSET
eukprot:gnl/TRDRNA2_/TRDRNA2_187054_c0_seq1.p1 gnl/TRDRNA2_/TRDRNA2_187054_c0~~gnl/TRDRNA2_/TRDRNA2_187054_c0_seq1.p1  ORF type:complete len:226 (+),score=42.85 gnl/TRDRNA2_/TRDRNA2_187054_c0_seq1:127-804(+)